MDYSKERALTILKKYLKKEENIRHNLEVGAAMHALAEYFNEDVDEWEVTGLLHDIDLELYEGDINQHTIIGGEILKKEGLPEEFIKNIQTHNDATGFKRETKLQHCLYSADGLTGLIHAYVLMRPDKDIQQASVKSINKKFKDKHFAKGVSREEIRAVEETLGIDLKEFIGIVLKGMQKFI